MQNMIKNMFLKRVIIFLTVAATNICVISAGVNSYYPTTGFEIMQSDKGKKVKKAQKEQNKKEEEKRKAIIRSSKETQKNAYSIQSPEVKERMKQNKKEIAAREKARKKFNKSKTRKGARRYK